MPSDAGFAAPVSAAHQALRSTPRDRGCQSSETPEFADDRVHQFARFASVPLHLIGVPAQDLQAVPEAVQWYASPRRIMGKDISAWHQLCTAPSCVRTVWFVRFVKRIGLE
jgi:hypothetical protein